MSSEEEGRYRVIGEFAMASPDNIKHAELFSRQAGLVQTPGVGGRGRVGTSKL